MSSLDPLFLTLSGGLLLGMAAAQIGGRVSLRAYLTGALASAAPAGSPQHGGSGRHARR
jgi:hypothetical protein